jgi:hypothetical protein
MVTENVRFYIVGIVCLRRSRKSRGGAQKAGDKEASEVTAAVKSFQGSALIVRVNGSGYGSGYGTGFGTASCCYRATGAI